MFISVILIESLAPDKTARSKWRVCLLNTFETHPSMIASLATACCPLDTKVSMAMLTRDRVAMNGPSNVHLLHISCNILQHERYYLSPVLRALGDVSRRFSTLGRVSVTRYPGFKNRASENRSKSLDIIFEKSGRTGNWATEIITAVLEMAVRTFILDFISY